MPATKIWQTIDHGQVYHWPVDKALKKLESELSFNITSSWPELRQQISHVLKGDDNELAVMVAKWIVCDWGGIRRGDEDAIQQWILALGDFSEAPISEFILRQGAKRISSWSKILSFSDPCRWAIYDSRTAFALNAALHLNGDPRRFVAVPSRNTKIGPAARLLGRDMSAPPLGYFDYLQLLTQFAREGLAADLLNAEQFLFANAPAMAEKLLA